MYLPASYLHAMYRAFEAADRPTPPWIPEQRGKRRNGPGTKRGIGSVSPKTRAKQRRCH